MLDLTSHPVSRASVLSASDESEPEQQPSRAPFDPDLDHSDDDDDDVCAPATIPTSQSSFSLSGGTSAFSDRSHSIFDCLDSIGRQKFSSRNQNTVADESSRHSQSTSHPSSICPTPPKKRFVPDYLVHPERWTHYSLEDVNESSDQENSRVAYQFLSSLGQEARGSSPCDLQHKMIFRPKQLLKEQPNDQLSPEEEDEEKGQKDEEKDTSGATGQGEETKEVQKEKKVEESRCQFTSFRNMMSKNYRKRSGCEDN
uniref:U5 small nuclear ribonucleoprotein TSSC4 n=1 Tax=Neolamprologus brichardi TaxID=32507 RepID=A0A3Q4GBC9_NEOBR